MAKKIIILDFDGTIADTRRIIVTTMQATLTEVGLSPRTDDECAAVIGLPLHECFTHLMPMDEETATRCEETYRRIFFEKMTRETVPVFPHVLDTLRQLQAEGVVLTIASSRSRGSLQHFVENMQLTDVISLLLGADDVTHAKPHPEPVMLTLQHFGLSSEEALVVGDTSFDIGMGRNAGCITCGVTYGNHSREQLQLAGADFIIDDFSDLHKIVHDLQ